MSLRLYSSFVLLTDYKINSVNFLEPVGPDGIDIAELRSIEADSMFAEYYYHFSPADSPFPGSNTAQAIAASTHDGRNDNVQWGQRQFCHISDVESDNEENNEDIMASYETLLMPRYQSSPSDSDFVTRSFAMPARLGTIAGMAIRDPTQPAQAPPIMHFEPRSSSDTIAEISEPTNGIAASASAASVPDDFDFNLTAAVHMIQARPTPTSRVASSQRFETISSPTDPNATIQSPVFPADWVTHTRTSMFSMLPSPATSTTPHRRHSRRHTINYTISPIIDRHTEDDEGDNA